MDTPPTPPQDELPSLVDALLEGYRSDPRGHHINLRFLPSRDEIIAILELLLQVMYPGYYGRQDLTDANLRDHIGMLVATLRARLARQVEMCLCFRREREAGGSADVGVCCSQSARVTTAFLEALPALRRELLDDVQAAFDGDPAATNLDEIILAYPGLLAITVHRLAHALHGLGVPLMPRIMTEWAHAQTGADLHPGAEIGRSFFIDHATGVVVGETARIGEHVKLYQGVTLGAVSHPHDAEGNVIRGTKRHPTVEDGVTVYANATVLGGTTTLGAGSVIGGSVFLTRSVPRGARVAVEPAKLRVRGGESSPPGVMDGGIDFEI